jgi:hypothetical protein
MGTKVVTVRRAVAAAVLATVAVPAASALAMSKPVHRVSNGSSSQKPAVVGPVLGILVFGDTVGLPLGCQLVTSAIGSGATYLGHAGTASPIIDKANGGCDTASAQGASGLAKAQKAAQPLNAINGYANPVIDQAANSVTQFGNDYGQELAPFGPTIAGSGDTIRFFEGK